ncbi:MAG: hypothetical protein CL739_07555 [Chloroflexi bacterium]|nr:hypothetical protein [Chloroflexota bacterium]|tara:strand:+ start:4072 stop:4314 length:243 start_codon:yes stop_codon:yes gene_type:complete
MNEATQLTLSIKDDKKNHPTFQNGLNINNGQKVKYLGNVSGGPLTGSKGIIKKLYANKAVVDMGLVGTWNVPYYFLSETA